MTYVCADHPALADHFPGQPIVPGALLLDHVVRTARASGHRVLGIRHAKFIAALGPEREFTITVTPIDTDTARFEVQDDTRLIAHGTLQLALTDAGHDTGDGAP